MARVINNPLLVGISGKLGDTIILKIQPDGSTVMANMPAERVKISEKQKGNSEKFRTASLWAKQQVRNPERKAMYTKGITLKKNNAYRVALTDYMTAPVIHNINPIHYRGAVGDLITINATDDFMVKEVTVELVSADNTTLEKGAATRNPRRRHIWHYRTTLPNPHAAGTKIRAKAFDLPGNETVAERVV